MQCQFCKGIFPTHDDVQLHQVNKCPAIENIDYIGPKPAEVTFSWKPSSQDTAYVQMVNCPYLLLSNLSDSIKLNVQNQHGEYTSECKQVHQGCYSGQLILDNNVIPIMDFTLTPTTDIVNISTVQSAERSALPVVFANEAAPSNSIRAPPMYMNYTLNKQSNIVKKIKACDRVPYTVKHNKGSVTITLNTMCFELMRSSLIQYLHRQANQYNFQIIPKNDQSGNTAEDVIKVNATPESTALYTINLYRTTSRIMVNGPQPYRFMDNDFPVITDALDDNADEIEEENRKAKSSLLSLKSNPSPNNPDLQSIKQNVGSEKTIMTCSRTRLSDTRSSDSTINDMPTKPDPQSQTITAEEKISAAEEVVAIETHDSHTTVQTKSIDSMEDPLSTVVPEEDKNHNKNESVVRKSSRCVNKTEKAQLIEDERKQKKKLSEKTSDASDVEHLDPVCPDCNKIVGNEGVVCEACCAYWHYKCANITRNEIKNLEGQDFLCKRHNQNVDKVVTTEPKLNEAEDGTILNESSDCCGNNAEEIVRESSEKISTWEEKYKEEVGKSVEKDKEISQLKEKLLISEKDKDTMKQEHEKVAHQFKLQITTWENKTAKTESSLEIINRKVATLEKEKIMHNSAAAQNQQTIDDFKIKIDELEKEKSELQREIKTHQDINEKLIANPQDKF